MAEAKKLAVRPRTVLGKKVGRLRREGTLPGVIFGGHLNSVPIETDTHAFELGYRAWGNTTLLSLEGLDGDAVPALVHSVSREPRTGRLQHVDLQRVSLTEKTHADVPLHFVGESAATKGGAVLVHALDSVEVEAFPQDIPHRIDVDLSPIAQIDDAIFVRDLVVDVATVRILNDPEDLVAKAVAIRVEAEPTPAAVAAEGAETAEGAEAAEGAEGAEGAPKPEAKAAGAKPEAKPEAKGKKEG